MRREDLARMKNGAVIVDVAIDQGGCVATSRPTTHRQPTYLVDGVVHYCVTNMPGAVGRTSTYALCNVTLPYVLQLAKHGWRNVAAADRGVAEGVNIDQRARHQPGRRRDLRIPLSSFRHAAGVRHRAGRREPDLQVPMTLRDPI